MLKNIGPVKVKVQLRALSANSRRFHQENAIVRSDCEMNRSVRVCPKLQIK